MMIHKDHFVPVTHAVGVEMVGIPYSHVRISPYYPSLGDSLERNSPGELEDPIAFCLLPEVGLGFLAPPRRTRTLTMTIPGFALYPRRRAVTSLVGRRILL